MFRHIKPDVSRPLQKGFKKENQTDICTDNRAMMHRKRCNELEADGWNLILRKIYPVYLKYTTFGFFIIDSLKACAWPYSLFISNNLYPVKTIYYKSLFKEYQRWHTRRFRLKSVSLFHIQTYIYFIHFSFLKRSIFNVKTIILIISIT